MQITFEPMFGAFIGGWEILIILMVMAVGLVVIGTIVAVIVVLLKRRNQNPQPPPPHVAKPPAVPRTDVISEKCPRCGTPLPAGVLAGLCPICLLKAGAAADSITDAKQPGFNPPSVAELAPLFPQLEILELIGKGGMGAVYKARQKQLDRVVALKILPPGIGADPAFAERFAREAKALAKLNHPGIVTLYEFGETSGQFYFLMEFVDGVNLRQLLHAGRVSPREALAIVPQICDALQFAHDQGIVHRDIKPENILLDRRGRVKVADFGLAKIVEGRAGSPLPADSMQTEGGAHGGTRPTDSLTDAGKVMGTPQYMSPEQIEAPGEVDHRADIYALGVVFYQMLTGELPAENIEPPSSKVQIDVRLDEVVLRALEKKPELRYQQVSQVKTCVETIVNSGSAGVPPRQSETAAGDTSPTQPPIRHEGEAGRTPAVAAQMQPRSRPQTSAPAISIMVIGGINIAGLLFGLCVVALVGMIPSFLGNANVHLNFPGWGGNMPSFLPTRMAMVGGLLVVVVWMLVWLAAWVIAFVGALRMFQRRRYGMAVAAASICIVAGVLGLVFNRIVSITGCWSALELGSGIWALVVLLRSEVKTDFAGCEARIAAARSAVLLTPEACNFEAVSKQVAAPAIGLMVVSGTSLLSLVAIWLILTFGVHWQSVGGTENLSLSLPGLNFSKSVSPGADTRPWVLILGQVLLPLAICPALITFLGGWWMRKMRGYGLAMTGAVLGMIAPPGMVLGFIFGVWAIVVLVRRPVHDAFCAEQSKAIASLAGRSSSTGKKISIGCGVLALGGFLVLALLAGTFLFMRSHMRGSVVRLETPAMTAAKVQAEAQMADARNRAEAQMAEAKARAEQLQTQAKANANLTFGPVMERVVNDLSANHGNEALELSSGKLMTLPAPAKTLNMRHGWMLNNHADLLVDSKANQRLEVVAGIKMVDIQSSDWDIATPQDISVALDEKLSVLSREVAGGEQDYWMTQSPAFPVTLAFQTAAKERGLLQITGYSENPRGVKIRYKLVQNGDSTGNATSSLFREYPVNRSWSELAQLPNTDSPEGVAARFTLAMLVGDPTVVMNRYGIGLVTLPPGAVKITVSDADRDWSRHNQPPKVAVYREELAAVFVPQNDGSGFATVLLGKRLGQWRVCLTLDLPKAQTLAGAEQAFRERAAELDDSFSKMPDQQPSVVEEATRELTTNLTQMTEAMVNSVTQMLSQVPGMQVGTPIIQSSMTVTIVTNTPNATSATEEAVYVIASGDTVARIASRFGLSLTDLMAMNPGLAATRLKIGQKIVVSTPARLKLQQAELNLKNAEMKFTVGTITEYELQKIRLARDLAAAEMNGDAPEIARIKLAVAELDLDVAGKQLAVGKATQQEYTQAWLARDYAAAAAQKYFPGPVVSPSADLKARLEAASSITSFTEQDKALAAIVRDAAKAGEAALARQALAKMTSFTAQDQAALEAARELVKAGRRTDAIDIARSMTSFTQRDAALKELAQ